MCWGRPRRPWFSGTGSPNRSKITPMRKKPAAETPAVSAPGADLTFTHPPLPQSIGPGLGGLECVMRSAKAFAVGRIIGSATVFHLDHMIGEHPMAGLCLGAPASGALIDVLAPSACPTDHGLSPCPVLRGQVERVRSLWLRLDGSCVEPVGDERTDLPHGKGTACGGRIRRRPKSREETPTGRAATEARPCRIP